MEKLKQEQQLLDKQKPVAGKKRGKITFHNPNSKEVTAKVIGRIVLKDMLENSLIINKQEKESGEKP
ncbi:hypothetical protein acsn021_42500 [Anaerocolumna cellulosilytica]|uniref:Uncharacterized protein n=1 Tax=Anaerocolumna cellulosilytica TaxID=433286 RepID=A0A6S6RD90_9FIRM|nr:hypothetical protein [Anaerocolumna cellulosilytica]MBB5195208.1 hypothetical protein [Anaerocolumna cellulosilytica]BCJ96681.1 hypothetical protein acsn021_42500 [Anaerocolumna cellulosilytica]